MCKGKYPYSNSWDEKSKENQFIQTHAIYKETKQNYNSSKKSKEKNRRDKEKQALPRIDLSHATDCFPPRVF